MAAIGAPVVCSTRKSTSGLSTSSNSSAPCSSSLTRVHLGSRSAAGRSLALQRRPTHTNSAFLQSSLLSLSQRSRFFHGSGGRMLLTSVAASGDGGGAMGARMNIFERVVRVVRSYVNAVISAAEDPEKLLDQTVLEMNEDLIKMRQASAQVLASQKQLENKYKQAEENSQSWYKRAKLALEKGDEVLAREALKRRKDYEDNAKGLKAQLEQQKSVVEKLISNTRLLESKIQEARSKKDTLKARAQSAKTSQKVNEMLGNINTSSALAAFEKMEEKVTALEAESDALNQLNTDELAGRFALLEGDNVDDDLAALKQDMLSSSKKPGELPAGRSSISSSSSSNPFTDVEIEKELNELRRKTREL